MIRLHTDYNGVSLWRSFSTEWTSQQSPDKVQNECIGWYSIDFDRYRQSVNPDHRSSKAESKCFCFLVFLVGGGWDLNLDSDTKWLRVPLKVDGVVRDCLPSQSRLMSAGRPVLTSVIRQLFESLEPLKVKRLLQKPWKSSILLDFEKSVELKPR